MDNHINSIPLVPYIEANGDLFFIRNIVQNRVHLFNESNSLILPSSIGRGPFEINQIFATNYDFKSNRINIFDFSLNKIVQYKIDDFSVIDTVEYLDVIPKKTFISEPFMSSYESKFYFPVVSSTEYDDTNYLLLSFNIENGNSKFIGHYEKNKYLADDFLDVHFFDSNESVYAVFRASGIVHEYSKINDMLVSKYEIKGSYKKRVKEFTAEEKSNPALRIKKANSYSKVINVMQYEDNIFVLFAIDNEVDTYYLYELKSSKEYNLKSPVPFHITKEYTLLYDSNNDSSIIYKTTSNKYLNRL